MVPEKRCLLQEKFSLDRIQIPIARLRGTRIEGDLTVHRSWQISRAVGFAVALASTPVLAASQPADVSLEEIIVTAQKREERLSETPLSLSVLSSNDLNAIAAT